MIKNMFYTFSLDKQNIIKYGLGLKNNVFTLNIPVENTTDTIPLKIEVNNINEFKIKNIFQQMKSPVDAGLDEGQTNFLQQLLMMFR